jgi:hypothetical protein
MLRAFKAHDGNTEVVLAVPAAKNNPVWAEGVLSPVLMQQFWVA